MNAIKTKWTPFFIILKAHPNILQKISYDIQFKETFFLAFCFNFRLPLHFALSLHERQCVCVGLTVIGCYSRHFERLRGLRNISELISVWRDSSQFCYFFARRNFGLICALLNQFVYIVFVLLLMVMMKKQVEAKEEEVFIFLMLP